MQKLFLSFIYIFLVQTFSFAQNTILNQSKTENEFGLGLELIQIETNGAAYAIFNHYAQENMQNLKNLDAKYYEAFLLLSVNNPKGEIFN